MELRKSWQSMPDADGPALYYRGVRLSRMVIVLEPYRRRKNKIAPPPMVVLPLILLTFSGCGGKRRKEVGIFIGLRKRTLADMPFVVERSRGREVERSRGREVEKSRSREGYGRQCKVEKYVSKFDAIPHALSIDNGGEFMNEFIHISY